MVKYDVGNGNLGMSQVNAWRVVSLEVIVHCWHRLVYFIPFTNFVKLEF